jgi:hypothetical protein
MQFGVECDLVWYENKVGTIEGIHSLNLQGENSPKGVQKLFQNDNLPINLACVGTPTWNNHKKVQGPNVAKNNHLIWGVM